MIYTLDISTLTTHTKAAPLHSVLKLTKGLVYKVEVEFPPGCAGVCHVVICDGGYQVWPSTPGETWHSDGQVIAFDDTYLKEAAPFQFDIYSYNVSSSFDHTPQIRIGLVSQKVFMARFMPSLTYEYFLEALQELRTEQEKRYSDIIQTPFPWMEEK